MLLLITSIDQLNAKSGNHHDASLPHIDSVSCGIGVMHAYFGAARVAMGEESGGTGFFLFVGGLLGSFSSTSLL